MEQLTLTSEHWTRTTSQLLKLLFFFLLPCTENCCRWKNGTALLQNCTRYGKLPESTPHTVWLLMRKVKYGICQIQIHFVHCKGLTNFILCFQPKDGNFATLKWRFLMFQPLQFIVWSQLFTVWFCLVCLSNMTYWSPTDPHLSLSSTGSMLHQLLRQPKPKTAMKKGVQVCWVWACMCLRQPMGLSVISASCGFLFKQAITHHCCRCDTRWLKHMTW